MSAGPIPSYDDVGALIAALHPTDPVFCIRPRRIERAARRFASLFPGRVLYAVKCNPHPLVLEALGRSGIRDFDTASLPEIVHVGSLLPGARSYFLHPVKDREAIRRAHREHGVRHFVVDCAAELRKLFEETGGGGSDIVVVVRIATPEAADVLYHLADKFGAAPAEAADLLLAASEAGCQTGLSFHVGSQCLDPKAYRLALQIVGEVIAGSGCQPVCIDVGGGFPEAYPSVAPPPLEAYVEAVREGFAALGLAPSVELWAEPGRALVASGASVVAQVKLRRGDRLYINDGVYGSFSELIDSEYELPARLFSSRGQMPREPRPFAIYGPTCDSMDAFTTPLLLPANVDEGDWIEIDQVGAYSNALATRFNGFEVARFAELRDDPPASELLPAAGVVDSS